MKTFRFILCALLVLVFPSCSTDDDIVIDSTVSPISLEELKLVAGNSLYYCDWSDKVEAMCLKKDHGKWLETKPEFPAHESKPGDLDSNPAPDCLKLLDPYRVLVPEYFWFHNEIIYSDYSEMVYSYAGDDYKYADFTYNENMEIFYHYLNRSAERESGRFTSEYYFFMRNEINIEDGNRLQMSFSNHPLRKHKNRSFNFILEKATSSSLIIRVEFDNRILGCDGVRLIYKPTRETPKAYCCFNSKQEAELFVNSTLAMYTEELNKYEAIEGVAITEDVLSQLFGKWESIEINGKTTAESSAANKDFKPFSFAFIKDNTYSFGIFSGAMEIKPDEIVLYYSPNYEGYELATFKIQKVEEDMMEIYWQGSIFSHQAPFNAKIKKIADE